MHSTIYALASAVGRSGVAVVRISGDKCLEVVNKLGVKQLPLVRTVKLQKLYNYLDNNSILDYALLLYFKAPNSFTGEDVLEIHFHGSRAIINTAFEIFDSIDNVRLAEAGEFTKRAFHNGKIDLLESEGLIDLINAETAAQMKQAQLQFRGFLSNLYNGWSNVLIKLLAHYEAYIDFPDEDIPETLHIDSLNKVNNLISAMENHLSDNNKGERLRNGIKVAVLGEPNAGKSSLVNILAKRDVAIVSDSFGTTRDIIEISLDINGYPVILFDTAGIRESSDEIEKEGIKRALFTARESDIIVLMIDGVLHKVNDDFISDAVKNFDNKKAEIIICVNKSDSKDFKFPKLREGIFCISTYSGYGLNNFLEYLGNIILKSFSSDNSEPLITRQRHRFAIKDSMNYLKQFLETSILELKAENLRLSVRSLGKITGQVDIEDLLDIIFNDFCIGK